MSMLTARESRWSKSPNWKQRRMMLPSGFVNDFVAYYMDQQKVLGSFWPGCGFLTRSNHSVPSFLTNNFVDRFLRITVQKFSNFIVWSRLTPLPLLNMSEQNPSQGAISRGILTSRSEPRKRPFGAWTRERNIDAKNTDEGEGLDIFGQRDIYLSADCIGFSCCCTTFGYKSLISREMRMFCLE